MTHSKRTLRQRSQFMGIPAVAERKRPRKAAAGQKEMPLPIEGKKPKKTAKSDRSNGRWKAG
jgi:hypothetical protein